MEKIRGIGVSPGIVFGKAFVLNHENYRVTQHFLRDRSPSGKDEEKARYEQAVLEIIAEYEQTVAKLREVEKKTGQTLTGIVEFPKSILGMADLKTTVHAYIDRRGQTAEAGVQIWFRKYRQIFEGNPMLEKNLADLNHVESRLLRQLLGERAESIKDLTSPVILIAGDLDPATTAELPLDKVLGFATDAGGQTSHTAILANSRNIPAVVGLGRVTKAVSGGETIIIDGREGQVIVEPDNTTLEKYRASAKLFEAFNRGLRELRTYPPETIDGYKIRLMANIEFPQEVRDAVANGAEGIGLYRTEFLYSAKNPSPSEEEHFAAYSEALDNLSEDGQERPLVIRTIDLGADKFSPDTVPEKNPFLGLRSIRWCFANRGAFITQLRAILRVSVRGDVRIMLPMISALEDLLEARAIIDDVKEDLRRRGEDFNDKIKIGIMVEVPSAAIIADVLAQHVDFFSIGTNDLVQYTLAVDRVNERVKDYYRPGQLSILRLLLGVVGVGRRFNKSVSLCGELSGDPRYTLALVGLGLTELSMAPASVPKVKKFVRSMRMRRAHKVARQIFEFSRSQQVERYLLEQGKEIVPDFFVSG